MKKLLLNSFYFIIYSFLCFLFFSGSQGLLFIILFLALHSFFLFKKGRNRLFLQHFIILNFVVFTISMDFSDVQILKYSCEKINRSDYIFNNNWGICSKKFCCDNELCVKSKKNYIKDTEVFSANKKLLNFISTFINKYFFFIKYIIILASVIIYFFFKCRFFILFSVFLTFASELFLFIGYYNLFKIQFPDYYYFQLNYIIILLIYFFVFISLFYSFIIEDKMERKKRGSNNFNCLN